MTDRFLVDTDILSVGAPSKARSIPQLIEWLDRNSERLYVSGVTITEIENGIAKSRRADDAKGRPLARMARDAGASLQPTNPPI